MSVDQLTVQQLKIFLAVYKHKSASLAAAELGVTNSTVSRALAAARSVFDDVLFVRTANGFVPTNKAHELASPTSDIVSILRKIDTRYTRFLPATCTGSIEIRAYDEFNYAVQRVIQTRIQPLAPRMHFHVSALTYDCVNELLNGTVDYAVVYEGFNDNRLNFDVSRKRETSFCCAAKDIRFCQATSAPRICPAIRLLKSTITETTAVLCWSTFAMRSDRICAYAPIRNPLPRLFS